MGSIEALTPILNDRDDPVELILLGTGPSSTLPHVDCLTAPPDAKPCRACMSTLWPGGRKNKRGNTSAVLRIRGRDGKRRTIVIDVGKSFTQAAVEWFPKYGLRRIDAVLITHAHADAINGLDDLRGWTLGGAIQPCVDIYLSAETFEAVKIAFPYMVKKELATGGGAVPEFRWHPWVTDREPFEIGGTGIMVKPFAVPHGLCSVKPVRNIPDLPEHTSKAFENKCLCESGLQSTPTGSGLTTPVDTTQDFLCLGFTIQDAVTYISDASRIPDDVMDYLQANPGIGSSTSGPPVLVLDCLSLRTHRSHLSLAQSVGYARRLKARKTYLVGFDHDVSHEEYETMLWAVGGRRPSPKELTETVIEGLKTLNLGGEPIWIRPGYDGLRIFVSDDGQATDVGSFDFPEEL